MKFFICILMIMIATCNAGFFGELGIADVQPGDNSHLHHENHQQVEIIKLIQNDIGHVPSILAPDVKVVKIIHEPIGNHHAHNHHEEKIIKVIHEEVPPPVVHHQHVKTVKIIHEAAAAIPATAPIVPQVNTIKVIHHEDGVHHDHGHDVIQQPQVELIKIIRGENGQHSQHHHHHDVKIIKIINEPVLTNGWN